jgi:hypothetical protein
MDEKMVFERSLLAGFRLLLAFFVLCHLEQTFLFIGYLLFLFNPTKVSEMVVTY